MSEPEQKINFVNVILSLPLHPSIPPSLHPSIPPDITTMSANVQQVASGLVTAYEHALKLLTDETLLCLTPSSTLSSFDTKSTGCTGLLILILSLSWIYWLRVSTRSRGQRKL